METVLLDKLDREYSGNLITILLLWISMQLQFMYPIDMYHVLWVYFVFRKIKKVQNNQVNKLNVYNYDVVIENLLLNLTGRYYAAWDFYDN